MRKPLLGAEHRNSTLIVRDGSDAEQLLKNDDDDDISASKRKGVNRKRGGNESAFIMEDYRPKASWMTLIAFWICGTGQ